MKRVGIWIDKKELCTCYCRSCEDAPVIRQKTALTFRLDPRLIILFPPSIVDARVSSDVCPMFFNLGESEVLKYPFQNAGFADISMHKIVATLNYATAEEAILASFLGGPVAMAYARFDAATKKEVHEEYVNSIEPYKTHNGYEIPGEFVICSGVKS